MAGEWQAIPFSQAVTVNPRVPLARGATYPFVDMGAVSAGVRSAYATEAREFDGGGSRFAVGDTLMARITPCLENGKIARFAGKSGQIAHGSTEFIVLRGRDGMSDTDYAYYLTKWDGVSGYAISQMTGTSGRQRVPLESLDHLEVPLPPLREQRAIAHILGTLDDKIELNRRMSETLEAMARALFKAWFVDFDPVRAKAHLPSPTGRGAGGEGPAWPQNTLDLFPARLVDSELGEIPEGWEVGPLESVLVLQRGFDLPATQRTSGPYPVLAASGPSGTHDKFMVSGPGVTTGRSGVLGNVYYVAEDFWPLNTSLWVKEFRHSRPAYAFYLLQGLNFALFNAGSAVPTLNRNHVHTLPTLLPPMALIDAFERTASISLRRRNSSGRQSATLAALRDTLLPKLISGELRVKDAEKIIEVTA